MTGLEVVGKCRFHGIELCGGESIDHLATIDVGRWGSPSDAPIGSGKETLKSLPAFAEETFMNRHSASERSFTRGLLVATASAAILLGLAGCGSSKQAYTPPITAAEGKLPDRLALQEVADKSTTDESDQGVCNLYRQIVTGSGPAGYANFDLKDPDAVKREFEFEYSLMKQVAEVDFPMKDDVQIYLAMIETQLATLTANGWNMLDPKVLGAYQSPDYTAAIGRIQIWGASECGALTPEDGLLNKLTALLFSGGQLG